MEEKATSTHTTGLIYGLNDRPPVREAIFAAIQHLLAIFVAIITPPLIIAGALKLDLETTSFRGIHGIVCLRHLYLHPMQTHWGYRNRIVMHSRNQLFFIGPIISAGMLGGLPLIFGTCIAASSVEMVISRILEIYP